MVTPNHSPNHLELQKQKERVSTPEATTLLPLHSRQQQQPLRTQSLQLGQVLDERHQLFSRLSSKPAVAVLYALLLIGLIYHVSRGSSSTTARSTSIQQLQLHSYNKAAFDKATSSAGTYDYASTDDLYSISNSSGPGTVIVPCAYGSLSGSWVSAAPAGRRWQVLDPDCQLTNWLVKYEAAAHSSTSSSNIDRSSMHNRSISSDNSAVEVDVEVGTSATVAVESRSSGTGSQQEFDQLAPVRILLLSDSVDRFIVEHVCETFGGIKETHMMKPTAAAEEAERAAEAAAAAAAAAAGDQDQQPGSVNEDGPALLNKTAYAFHTCNSAAPVKLASSYFPGVHPTGPYHRFSAQNYKQRIDSARQMWSEYAGPGNEPQMVSVASLLWDVARMYMHEKNLVEGREELERSTLDMWLANFTSVVEYAQAAFPKTKLWVTHTTMPPRYDVNTGLMVKPYLGRLYFIHQLNAAAATAARQLDMQLVDYEAVARRFAVGQEHLTDMIHPNAMVGVEVFNVMLNLVLQQLHIQEKNSD